MLQYLKLNESILDNKRFELVRGKRAVWALGKSFIAFAVMVYATLFVAVATPFLKPHNPIIYIVGFIISAVLFARLVIFVIRYLSYRAGSISFDKKGISIVKKNSTIEIPMSSLDYLEYNLLGDLVIRKTDGQENFPLHLLEEKDRKDLFALFSDMAPSRTAFLRKAWELGDAIVVAMILAVHIIQFLIQNFYIPTGSMISTLMISDHLFAEKITFGPRIPKMIGMDSDIHIKIPFISRDVRRGDIIIFNPPAASGDIDKDYIKRCIAIEGDDYRLKGGSVYVNGKKLEEPYTTGSSNPGTYPIEGIVPKGMVIAMGDNREHSSDSRYFGYVPVTSIKARALIMYLNWDQMIGQLDFSRFGLIR